MKAPIPFCLLCLLAFCIFAPATASAQPSAPLEAGQMAAVVRPDGLLVLLPQVAGPGTYGTYLVPNELGREDPTRFFYKGNPLQMNFLAAQAFPREFAKLSAEEKLPYFFQFEAKHQREKLGTNVRWEKEKATSGKGGPRREGVLIVTIPDGSEVQVHIVARTAGHGILHGGWQSLNPKSVREAEALVRKMLDSFTVVRRALDNDELTRLSKQAAGE